MFHRATPTSGLTVEQLFDLTNLVISSPSMKVSML
jgi:hypothetical protein